MNKNLTSKNVFELGLLNGDIVSKGSDAETSRGRNGLVPKRPVTFCQRAAFSHFSHTLYLYLILRTALPVASF